MLVIDRLHHIGQRGDTEITDEEQGPPQCYRCFISLFFFILFSLFGWGGGLCAVGCAKVRFTVPWLVPPRVTNPITTKKKGPVVRKRNSGKENAMFVRCRRCRLSSGFIGNSIKINAQHLIEPTFSVVLIIVELPFGKIRNRIRPSLTWEI